MKPFIILLSLFLLPVLAHAADFVSLTDIPAFTDVNTAEGLTGILNAIYRISIGAAAAIAVFQLIRSGFAYMSPSVPEKKKARERITMTFLGLLLVLSPAIIFGLIDQRILELSFDASPLQVESSKLKNASVCPAITNMQDVTNNSSLERCCIEKGWHVLSRSGNLRGERKVCSQNAELSQSTEDPSGSGRYDDGTYFINIPKNPDDYFFTFFSRPTNENECLKVSYAILPSEISCQSILESTKPKYPPPTWNLSSACNQIPGKFLKITSRERPICTPERISIE